MGDACVNDNGGNPCIKMSVIQREYLEYLHDIFGEISRGVEIDRTSEQLARQNKKRGFSTTVVEENYNDVYMWHTVNHPELKAYRQWYESGKKEWPQDIALTPTVLKHFYVCDGTLSNRKVQLFTSNEIGNSSVWEEKLSSIGIDSTVQKYQRDNGKEHGYFYLYGDNTESFFGYIGEPVPGFEYKWPDSK